MRAAEQIVRARWRAGDEREGGVVSRSHAVLSALSAEGTGELLEDVKQESGMVRHVFLERVLGRQREEWT